MSKKVSEIEECEYKLIYAKAVEKVATLEEIEHGINLEKKLRELGCFGLYTRRGDLANVANGGRPKYQIG